MIPESGRSAGEGIGYPLQYPWASVVAQLVKNLPLKQETHFDSWVGKIPWRRDRLPTPVSLGFPDSSVGKESACKAGDLGSIPGLGRSLGEGKGSPVFWPGEFHGLYSPWGRKASHTTEQLHFHFSLSCIGEGNGKPLQCSCLENPRDGGAWWAAVYGVAQSWT